MSALSHNMKLIRKRLNCTQTAFSQILDIGFRTYVRYESGERDVPAVVLEKLSNLGNISLDRLLTTRLDAGELDIPDNLLIPEKPESYTVISGSRQEGRIMLKGYRRDFLITQDAEEKKILNHFRTLSPASKSRFLDEMENTLQSHSLQAKNKTARPNKQLRRRGLSQLKKIARSVKV